MRLTCDRIVYIRRQIRPRVVVPRYPKPLSNEAWETLVAGLEKGQSEDQRKIVEEARRTIRNLPWSTDKDRRV